MYKVLYLTLAGAVMLLPGWATAEILCRIPEEIRNLAV